MWAVSNQLWIREDHLPLWYCHCVSETSSGAAFSQPASPGGTVLYKETWDMDPAPRCLESKWKMKHAHETIQAHLWWPKSNGSQRSVGTAGEPGRPCSTPWGLEWICKLKVGWLGRESKSRENLDFRKMKMVYRRQLVAKLQMYLVNEQSPQARIYSFFLPC